MRYSEERLVLGVALVLVKVAEKIGIKPDDVYLMDLKATLGKAFDGVPDSDEPWLNEADDD